MSVNIKYKGSSIAQMEDSGTKTLKTSGMYCEGDIVVEYINNGTGGGTVTENFKRWDITVTDGLPEDGAVYRTLLVDQWLADNRTNPTLCVAVIPRFTVPYDSTVGTQGLYFGTNMDLMTDSSNILYRSIGAYVHKNGGISARVRKYNLTNANDIGDISITASGRLYAICSANYPLATGDYTIFAFIV